MSSIHSQAKRGIKLLMGRQVVMQIMTAAGGIVLARLLTPAEFGLYAIASYMVSIFALLGDFGLAPSFIQRKAELTERDLQVGFTLQQILTSVIVVALFLAAPWLVNFYPQAPPETVWLLRVLAVDLYLTSWRAMSAIQLERNLQYERLAPIEVIEALSYQGLVVILALQGYGVWSFVWAVLVRGLLGTLMTYLVAPWKMRLCFDLDVTKEILGYGIPFQLQNLTQQMDGWITPLLVGSLIGPQAVGYLSWASSNANRPLVLVSNVMRVSFVHFSRVRDNQAEVDRLVQRYLTVLLLIAGLWFSVILVAGQGLVSWIYSDKWLPAVPALILYAIHLGSAVVGWVVVVTLNSLGEVKIPLQQVLIRISINIPLTILLVSLIGFNGVPLGYLISTVFAVPWLFRGLGKETPKQVIGVVVRVVLSIVAASAIGGLTLMLFLPTIPKALLSTAVTTCAYAIAVWLVSPKWLRESIVDRLTALKVLGYKKV